MATPLGSVTAQLVISEPLIENLRTRLWPLSATGMSPRPFMARPYGDLSTALPQDVMNVPLELYLAMELLGVSATRTSPLPISVVIPNVPLTPIDHWVTNGGAGSANRGAGNEAAAASS